MLFKKRVKKILDRRLMSPSLYFTIYTLSQKQFTGVSRFFTLLVKITKTLNELTPFKR